MANFLIRVLKWLAALVTAYFLLFFLIFLLIIGIGVAFQPTPTTVNEDSILVMDLGFQLTDQPREDTPGQMLQSVLEGELIGSASLKEVLDGLNTARQDSRIKGLLIRGNLISGGSGSSFAGLREVRRAIRVLAEEKPVWAYVQGDSLRDIYLKSAATEVISDPNALVDFRGLRAERLYLGKAFERVGIEVQVEAFEEYKTAAEAYQEGSMSDEERTQLSDLIEDMWTVIVGDISQARGVDTDDLNVLAGSELVVYGDEVTDSGLSDRQLSEDALIEFLAGESAYDTALESFRQIGFLEYLQSSSPMLPEFGLIGDGNKVAILYADGVLVDGEGSENTIGGDRLVRFLREMRKDDSVKAVVLRINSPGGSAIASFKVVREIELTNAEKPVVASMGGIAASAGYMIAATCDTIFAEPSTITGSIGVVMMLPNVEKLATNLSMKFDGVETHPFAGTFSIGRSKTPEEMEQLHAFGKAFYENFLNLVAQHREMTVEEVRAKARGRVWSGLAAMQLGLVDDSGGLYSAVKRAADLAGIGDNYSILERPRKRSIEEQLEDLLTQTGVSQAISGRKPSQLTRAWHELEAEIQQLGQLNDPYGQYAILPYSLKIK